jgi:2-methylcitrate dehydratase
MGLGSAQLAHCISMAVVPNVILNQVRESHKSHYKVVAAGHAGRAAVFAALLARSGMEGPHLPFEGKAGWCTAVALKPLVFDTLGGEGTRFKILDSRTRHRPAMGETHAAIFAAENIAPKLTGIADITSVKIETYKRAKELVGSREHAWCWDPKSPESADQSIPYLVAITLRDGTVTPQSFKARDLADPQLRELMEKSEVVENEAFTEDFNLRTLRADESLTRYERLPREHRARITVTTRAGQRLIAESGGDPDDLSVQRDDARIEAKFRSQTEDLLGGRRVNAILDRLWNLESLSDAALIAPLLALG